MQKNKVLWLYGELPGLVRAGVLTQADAARIRAHYGEAHRIPLPRIAMLFCGVLGAALIGGGVILLFAHNWAALPRAARTVLSFMPLLCAQALAGWVIGRRSESAPWREGSGVFLALCIGACIALIGQTYHIPGNLASFLLTWCVLGLPIIYLLHSIAAMALYLAGITAWAGAAQAQLGHAALFWPLFAAALPFAWRTWQRYREQPRGLLIAWALCLCLCVSLGIVMEKNLPGLWILAYAMMLWTFYLVGRTFFDGVPGQPFTLAGVCGLTVLALLLSYPWPWEEIGFQHYRRGYEFHPIASAQDYALVLAWCAAALMLAVRRARAQDWGFLVWAAVPALAAPLYAATGAGMTAQIAANCFSLCLLIMGAVVMSGGVRAGRLAVANGGLAILCLLLVARFFDAELSFVARGVAFIIAGIAFLSVNVVLSRRARAQEEAQS